MKTSLVTQQNVLPELVVIPKPAIEQTELGDMDEDNAARYVSYRLRKAIKPRTLQNWRLNGEGPKYIAGPGGRPITYRETDIDKWLETKCLNNPQDWLGT